MERYTKKERLAGHNVSHVDEDACFDVWSAPKKFVGTAIDRLTAYEDTGYEPAEIKSLEAEWNACRVALDSYRALGTVEEFRALKEAEQKRREGCQRCWNGECMMSGVDYSCETTCDKCRYNLRDKHFCPHCGRDLRGESHE